MSREERRKRKRLERKNRKHPSTSNLPMLTEAIEYGLGVAGIGHMGFTLLLIPKGEAKKELCNYIAKADRETGTMLLYELAGKIDVDFPHIGQDGNDLELIESASEILLQYKKIVFAVIEGMGYKADVISLIYDLGNSEDSMMHYFSTVQKQETVNMLDATAKRLREDAGL